MKQEATVLGFNRKGREMTSRLFPYSTVNRYFGKYVINSSWVYNNDFYYWIRIFISRFRNYRTFTLCKKI